jgi:hypothetical protein
MGGAAPWPARVPASAENEMHQFNGLAGYHPLLFENEMPMPQPIHRCSLDGATRRAEAGRRGALV